MNNLKSVQKSVFFEQVTGSSQQIKILYDLLKKRKYNISHTITPPPKQHAIFVKSHPYRVWYLIRDGDNYVGTVYLLKNNSIGFSCIENKYWAFEQTLQFIQSKYKPLKEIKSLRPPYFYINIPIKNKKLIQYLDISNAIKLQVSFALIKSTVLKSYKK